MGVWIETWNKIILIWLQEVTPFVGVWIETYCEPTVCKLACVTPFVGVWIETLYDSANLWHMRSHTLRGCVD